MKIKRKKILGLSLASVLFVGIFAFALINFSQMPNKFQNAEDKSSLTEEAQKPDKAMSQAQALSQHDTVANTKQESSTNAQNATSQNKTAAEQNNSNSNKVEPKEEREIINEEDLPYAGPNKSEEGYNEIVASMQLQSPNLNNKNYSDQIYWKYDDNDNPSTLFLSGESGTGYNPITRDDHDVPVWFKNNGVITKVVIESEIKPECAKSFFGVLNKPGQGKISSKINEIDNLGYIDFSECADTSYMFAGVGYNGVSVSLTGDVPTWTLDTEGDYAGYLNLTNVANTYAMFCCSNINCGFNREVKIATSESLTNASCMFQKAGNNFTTADMSKFNMSDTNDLNISYMFNENESLTTIDGWGKLNANNVTSARSMFNNDPLLTELDLFNWSGTPQAAPLMFNECAALTKIMVANGTDWTSLASDNAHSYNIFAGCSNLKGGLDSPCTGKTEDSGLATYALVDKGVTEGKGFFTTKYLVSAKADDNEKGSVEVKVKKGESGTEEICDASFYVSQKTENQSDHDKYLFTDNSTDPKTIYTIYYHNNNEYYTDFNTWYYKGSTSGPYISSPWEVSASFNALFFNLESSNVNTTNNTTMTFVWGSLNSKGYYIPKHCDSEDVDGRPKTWKNAAANITNVNFTGVKDMQTKTNPIALECTAYWFKGFTSLTSIDLTDLETNNVKHMAYMFDGCTNLTTITASSSTWSTSSVTDDGANMFNGCVKITGGNGTTLNSTNKTYARFDTNDDPGYFNRNPGSTEEGKTVYSIIYKDVNGNTIQFTQNILEGEFITVGGANAQAREQEMATGSHPENQSIAGWKITGDETRRKVGEAYPVTGNIEFIPIWFNDLADPVQDGKIEYNNTSKTPTWVNNENYNTVVTAQIDAGTHNAKVTPNEDNNVCWQGGFFDEKDASWSIDKATVAAYIPDNNLKLLIGNTQTMTVSNIPNFVPSESVNVNLEGTAAEAAWSEYPSFTITTKEPSGAPSLGNVSFAGDENINPFSTSFSVYVEALSISGKLNVNNSGYSGNRTITNANHGITFTTKTSAEVPFEGTFIGDAIHGVQSLLNIENQVNDSVYTTTTDANGNYTITGLVPGLKGEISNDVIGCKTNGATKGGDTRTIAVNPLSGNLANQNFNLVGPDLDFYTLEELKTAGDQISNGDTTSAFYKEFNVYLTNDKVWWSNSNGCQPSNATSVNANNASTNYVNQAYACTFKDTTKTNIDNYMFLRVIGLKHDDADGGGKTGLTLQPVRSLPVAYQNCISETTNIWWGNDSSKSSLIRTALNNGTIYNQLASPYKQFIQKAVKKSEKTRYGSSDNTHTDYQNSIDSMFLLGFTEVFGSGTVNNGYPNCKYMNNEGSKYEWYTNKGIASGTTQCRTNLQNIYLTNKNVQPDDALTGDFFVLFLRTPQHNSTDKFDRNMLVFNCSGNSTYSSFRSHYKLAICPAFCLGSSKNLQATATVDTSGCTVSSTPSGWSSAGTNIYTKTVNKGTTYDSIANEWKGHITNSDKTFIGFGDGIINGDITLMPQWSDVNDHFLYQQITTSNGSPALRIIGWDGAEKESVTIPAKAYLRTSAEVTQEELEKANMPLLPVTEIGNGSSISGTNWSSIQALSFEEPNNVVKIAANAFDDATSLNNISLGGNITEIGENAFNNTAYYKNEAASKNLVFDNTGICLLGVGTSLGENVNLGNASVIADKAFINKTVVKNITASDNLKYIGNDAFEGCSQLISFSNTRGLIDIRYKAFYNCSSLNDISFTNNRNIANIGESAFENCSSMKVEVNLSNCTNLTAINKNTFKGCGITKIILPTSITSIGESAFENCSSMSSEVNLYNCNKLTEIGKYAFKNSSITKITLPPKALNIREAIVDGTTFLNTRVPSGRGLIWDNSYDTGNANGHILAINLDSAKGTTFDNPNGGNAESLDLGTNVYTIAEKAISNSSKLKYIRVTNANLTMCDNAIFQCKELTTYVAKLVGDADKVTYYGSPFATSGTNHAHHAPFIIAGGKNTTVTYLNNIKSYANGATAASYKYTIINTADMTTTLADGNYYSLENNVNAKAAITANSCVLDLNGKTISRTNSSGTKLWNGTSEPSQTSVTTFDNRIFTVASNKTFRLDNTSNECESIDANGMITGGCNNNQNGDGNINVGESATFNLVNGNICKNASVGGAAVCITSASGTFNMYGGIINRNYAYQMYSNGQNLNTGGGALYMTTGTSNLYAGKVVANYARTRGGAFYLGNFGAKPVINLKGVQIGGVDSSDTTMFNHISYPTGASDSYTGGGAVYLYSNQTSTGPTCNIGKNQSNGQFTLVRWNYKYNTSTKIKTDSGGLYKEDSTCVYNFNDGITATYYKTENF